MKTLNKLSTFIVIILFSCSAFATKAPESFADLVEELTPVVVNISTTQTIEGGQDPFSELFSHDMPENSPFKDLPDLFKKFYGDKNGGGMERKTNSLGSGFIIAPDGYIVTNYHVVEKADEITVIFSNDDEAKATVVGKDAKTDIAVLKVEVDKKLPYAKWGDSDSARVGDWVIAIGNPFGLGGSVSAGIVSARARDINSGPFDDFIQTDAAINRGNSGGPLFNTEGEVIGVNSAIFSPSGGNVGIGFSVPASLAEPVVKQLKETGHIKRGWLGVKIQTVTDEIAESIGLKDTKGALVLEVTEDSPAGKAGVLSGDVILSFDGKDVATMKKLPRIVAETKVGKKVPLVVWRKEEKVTLLVTVAQLDEDEEKKILSENDTKSEDKKIKSDEEIMGLGISNINKDIRKEYGLSDDVKGVVVLSIDKNSPAIEKPIRAGDVIDTINQVKVTDSKQAKSLVEDAKKAGRKSVLFLLKRGDGSLFVALPFE